MGFISSATTTTTINLSAFLTQRGREFLINDIDRMLISTFSLGDPDHNYMGSGGTTPLQTGDVPDVTGAYSGCVFSVHSSIDENSLRNKILLKGENKLQTRKIKFKKNEDYINSGDTSYYQNLNVTVRLDRMIKYLLLESSEGRQSGSTYNEQIKSPYADFYSEIAVIVSSNTSNLETIERKEIKFKIGDNVDSDTDYFKRLFNINQTVLNNPASGINKYPQSEINTSEYPSPFVLSLSSYLSGETLNLGGSGKGGLIVYPRSLGYILENLNINRNSTATFPVINNTKKFYRDIDIENVNINFLGLNNNSKIIPAAVVDTGFDGIRVYEARSDILQDPIELMGNEIQGPDEIEKRWRNHYLRFYKRGLIQEEIKLLGNFIKNNSNSNTTNRLFDIIYSSDTTTPINYLSKKPLILVAKTNDNRDEISVLKIKFDLDVKNGIVNNQILQANPLGDLHNWSGLTSTELSEPFIVYD